MQGPWGGGGGELEVLEWGEGDVDLRLWWAWSRLGERERRWQGLGVEHGYGRRGEWEARRGLWGEGEGAMGRRWCAWRRLGERDRRWWGLGVGVAYGQRREQQALRGSWGEGEVDMGRRWRLGERERRERGPGGSRWRLGEREGREWVIEAWWQYGERECRSLVRRAGGERERRRLQDRGWSVESGQSGGVGGSWGAARGAAWYWGGWQGCGGGSGWWYGSGWARGVTLA